MKVRFKKCICPSYRKHVKEAAGLRKSVFMRVSRVTTRVILSQEEIVRDYVILGETENCPASA
jgi:hypothetical protein